MSELSRIALLDNQLANQIAAGEVVERPASVVKELLENSVDSHASRIEVDVERGGTRLIRVTDNGCGIYKTDLMLALTRHATSKIRSTDDLANISSLGFRGEALASISSVSKLILTSRTVDSELAWQATTHGREMTVDIQPASAAVGTRIEVADLFFNTPARQKFLRTEKTEFSHIEEVFKRQALANFNVAFVLKHNHKVIKRVPAFGDPAQWTKRIVAICGKPFADNSVTFQCDHEAIKLWGWLGKPSFHRSESDIQYVFINKRPVRDKTLNHAIRQAYEGLLPPGRMATYVIFLEIDPRQVDVNVHPTKHEVRLSEQRLIHDLLVKSIADALSEQVMFPEASTVQRVEESVAGSLGSEFTSQSQIGIAEKDRQYSDEDDADTSYSQKSIPSTPNYSVPSAAVPNARKSAMQVGSSASSNNRAEPNSVSEATSNAGLIPIEGNFWLIFHQRQAFAVDVRKLLNEYLEQLLKEKTQAESKPLLFPLNLTLSDELLEDFDCHRLLQRLGFNFTLADENQIVIRHFPEWLESVDKKQVSQELSDWMKKSIDDSVNASELVETMTNIVEEIPESLVRLLVFSGQFDWSKSQASKNISGDMIAELFYEE